MADSDMNLADMKVAILVTDGFEQAEFSGPKQALEDLGVTTTVIAPHEGKVQGFHHHDKGDSFPVDQTFAQASPAEFDGVLLPGGVINGDQLRVIDEARHFVQQMDEAGKPVFVICHGGWVLVSSGLVEGRTMTSWPTLRDDIVNAGGQWLDKEVVVDGNWVSSRKPDDLPAFNQKMIDMLRQKQSGKLPAQRGGDTGIGLAG